MIFVLPTKEEISKQLDIVNKARSDALQGIPPRDGTELSSTEKDILSYFVNTIIGDSLKESGTYLHEQRDARNKLHMDQVLTKIETTPDDLLAELDKRKDQQKNMLVNAKVAALQAESDYRLFRAENQLDRMPNYPESMILHWAVIAVIVVCETVLNSFFLAQGQELGLVGGFISALIITFANVGMALIVGNWGIPQLFHVQPKRKVIGWAVGTFYLFYLFALSLLVGHYRTELQSDPWAAAQRAIQSFRENPFELNDFNGWILVLISAIVGMIAMIKFFTADDPYPGYGEKDRKMKKKQRDYDQLKIQFSENLLQCVREFEEKLDSYRTDASHTITQYKASLKNSENAVNEYGSYIERVQVLYGSVINIYQRANVTVRAIDAPTYFHRDEVLPSSHIKMPDTYAYDEDKARLPEVEKAYEQCPIMFKSSNEKIIEIKRKLASDNEIFFKSVNDDAETDMSRQQACVIQPAY